MYPCNCKNMTEIQTNTYTYSVTTMIIFNRNILLEVKSDKNSSVQFNSQICSWLIRKRKKCLKNKPEMNSYFKLMQAVEMTLA